MLTYLRPQRTVIWAAILTCCCLHSGCGKNPITENPTTSPDDTPVLPAGDDGPFQKSPVADAGADPSALSGDRVVLDGGASFDSDNDELTFSWRQTKGSPIQLQGAKTAQASLVAPYVHAMQSYEFELAVSDGNFEDLDFTTLTVLPARDLSVDAGADQEIDAGTIVYLIATLSDAEAEAHAHVQWVQLEGPPVTLTDADKFRTTFVAPQNTGSELELLFEITVRVGDESAVDDVELTIRRHEPLPENDCVADAQCNDGSFCNGMERCAAGVCVAGTSPCPQQQCDEAADTCVTCANDANCSNGLFCDGAERCDNGLCVSGTAACGSQLCNEAIDACVDCLSAADCGDGLYCNGAESCLNGSCQSAAAPCPVSHCDEAIDTCHACMSNAECNDGQYCNGTETCTNHNCQSGAAPCALLFCSETTDACVECLNNGHCDDGEYCNGLESCSSGTCVPGQLPCAPSACNEANDACSGLVCSVQNPPFGAGQHVGTLLGSVADEASGLVASRNNPNVLWTHNDDTGDNRLFAININGTLLGTYTLGTGSVDPEDIAIGPGPVPGVDYLYWGNTGDNNNVRSTIFVKRVAEPTVSDVQVPPLNISPAGVDTLTFAYPAGATAPSHKDCETLLVDPLSGDFYFVTKRTSVGLVYRAAYPQATTGTTTLQYVASIDWGGAVGGDVSPDGQLIIIRRYSGNSPEASIWTRPSGGNFWDAFQQPRCDVQLMPEPQGEAIAWDAMGSGYFTVSENQTPGAQIPIWYFPRN